MQGKDVKARSFRSQLRVAFFHVYGGYDFNWARDVTIKPTIRGGNPVVIAEDLNELTTLDGFTVEADRLAEMPSQNNVAVYVRNSTGLSLLRLRIQGGDGGDGVDGVERRTQTKKKKDKGPMGYIHEDPAAGPNK